MSHAVSSLCNCSVILMKVPYHGLHYSYDIMIPMHGEVNQLFKPTQSRGVMEHPSKNIYEDLSKVLIVIASRTTLKEHRKI